MPVSQETLDKAENADYGEQQRARENIDILSDAEIERRLLVVNQKVDDPNHLQICPVCGNEAFVVSGSTEQGVLPGKCAVCDYERSDLTAYALSLDGQAH